MTFSIAARCPRTGMFGIAVSSSSMAVAARCAFVRAGVGAVASQNITDPRLGSRGLDLMAQGLAAPDALERLIADAPHAAYRQIALVDTAGGTAARSGAATLGIFASAEGNGAVAAGNLLADEGVPAAMIARFAETDDRLELGERLVRAMEAGLSAGGEAGPVRSAGLLVADRQEWPLVDLRVDWTDGDPIAALHHLWQGWSPQMHDYVTRAIDPTAAPSYGVPGDP